jgi:hypothetical protein
MKNLFQPLDLTHTVNRAAKNIVRNCYSSYYSGEVQKQLAAGIVASDVKVRLSNVKPMLASWLALVQVYQDMQNKRALIVKGFEKAGIIDALSMDYQLEENPFDHDDK